MCLECWIWQKEERGRLAPWPCFWLGQWCSEQGGGQAQRYAEIQVGRRWEPVGTEAETDSSLNHRERHRPRNCTRGRTRSGDRWTSGLGRQMSLCLFLPCSPGLLISWAHATPPATRPPAAAAAAVTIKPDSSLAQSPSPLLSLLPSFPAIISLVRNEPQRWSPTAAPSWSLCWAAVGTMAVTGEGHRAEGKLEAQLPPGRATTATVLRGLDTLNPR